MAPFLMQGDKRGDHKLFKYTADDQYTYYFDKKTMDSGQAIRIEFQEKWTKTTVYFNISLVIKNKNKDPYPTLEQTGKDGLKGLLWAKKKVSEFEKFIREDIRYEKSKIIMICRWDDKRRRDAYFYGLSKCGYKFGMLHGSKAILKQI